MWLISRPPLSLQSPHLPTPASALQPLVPSSCAPQCQTQYVHSIGMLELCYSQRTWFFYSDAGWTEFVEGIKYWTDNWTYLQRRADCLAVCGLRARGILAPTGYYWDIIYPWYCPMTGRCVGYSWGISGCSYCQYHRDVFGYCPDHHACPH
jgi:hypothetical protein